MISSDTFIKDTTLAIRAIITSGVTDPISATRSANSRFVVTNYPEKDVEYPMISVTDTNIATQRLGIASEMQWAKIPFEIRVWARSQTEKDSLTQQTLKTLRTNQYTGSATGTVDIGMYGYEVDNTVDVNESGKGGIKSKVISINYWTILS